VRDSPGIGGFAVQRMRVVFLGDSVTAGFGLSEHVDGVSYVQLLSARLADHPSSPELIASAWEGIDTAYALKRFNRMVTALDPDWVVILLGLNDAQPSGGRSATSPADYRSNLLALVDRVLALGARPVLVAPGPRFRPSPDDGQMVEIMGPYVAALRSVAEEGEFPWVDLHSPFTALEAVRELIPDGVHPGPAGHTLIADIMAAELPCLWDAHYSADDFEPSEEAPIGWPSGKGRAATE
jgi:lysophospholipase L1-like esterase